MHNQSSSGFTLIELIIVILILGILAVSAAPKFINISSDATAATVKGLAGALKGTIKTFQAKAYIMGKGSVTAHTQLSFGGNTYVIINQGIPREVWPNQFEHLIDGDFKYLGRFPTLVNVECEGGDFCIIDNLLAHNVFSGKGGYGIFFFPKGTKLGNKNCFAYYLIETNGMNGAGTLTNNEIDSVTTGC